MSSFSGFGSSGSRRRKKRGTPSGLQTKTGAAPLGDTSGKDTGAPGVLQSGGGTAPTATAGYATPTATTPVAPPPGVTPIGGMAGADRSAPIAGGGLAPVGAMGPGTTLGTPLGTSMSGGLSQTSTPAGMASASEHRSAGLGVLLANGGALGTTTPGTPAGAGEALTNFQGSAGGASSSLDAGLTQSGLPEVGAGGPPASTDNMYGTQNPTPGVDESGQASFNIDDYYGDMMNQAASTGANFMRRGMSMMGAQGRSIGGGFAGAMGQAQMMGDKARYDAQLGYLDQKLGFNQDERAQNADDRAQASEGRAQGQYEQDTANSAQDRIDDLAGGIAAQWNESGSKDYWATVNKLMQGGMSQEEAEQIVTRAEVLSGNSGTLTEQQREDLRANSNR